MWQGRTAGQVKMVQQAGTPSPGTPNCRWRQRHVLQSPPGRCPSAPRSPEPSEAGVSLAATACEVRGSPGQRRLQWAPLFR